MKGKVNLFLSIILLIIIASPSASLAWQGKIIDKDTGEPIEGAVIVRSWDRHTATPAGEISSLEYFTEVLSDKKGEFKLYGKPFHFSIPILSSVEENKTIIFKPGYKSLALDAKESIIKLEKVPSKLDIRKKELEITSHNYEIDYYVTKILNHMIVREEEFLDSDFHQTKRVAIGASNHRMPPIQPLSTSLQIQDNDSLHVSTKADQEINNQIITEKSLISDLKSKDFMARRKAASNLRKSNFSSLDEVELLIRALSDEDYGVRNQAAHGLGEKKDTRAVRPLIKSSQQDNNIFVRLSATESLGKIKDPQAVDPLINALNDENVRIRASAAEALGEINDKHAVASLMKALNDKDPDVMSKSLGALGKMGVIEPLIISLGEECYASRDVKIHKLIVNMGEPAVEPLIRALKKNPNSRIIEILGEIKDDRAIEPLIDSLDIPCVRITAIEALGNFNDKRAVTALIGQLVDLDAANQMVFVKARISLIKIGSKSVEPLIAKLNDKNPEIRRRVIYTIGSMDDKSIPDQLITLLKQDKEPSVRKAAALYLSFFKNHYVAKNLISSWLDEDREVRSEVTKSLVTIGSPALEHLFIALKNEDPYFRWRVAWCLGEIRDKEALKPLIISLNDRVSDVIWTATKALGKIGDKEAVGALTSLCNNADLGIREEAEKSLQKMNLTCPL